MHRRLSVLDCRLSESDQPTYLDGQHLLLELRGEGNKILR